VKPDFFIDLYALAKQITDYKIETDHDLETELKATLIFKQGDEDEAEEDSESSEEEEVISEEEDQPQTHIKAAKEEPAPTSKYTVDLSHIDSQWLIQQLSKFYENPELARIEK
jgi:hypothetical protein